MIRFSTSGKPEPKGSPRPLLLGNGKTIFTVMTKEGKAWQDRVAEVAARQMPDGGLIDYPVGVYLEFYLKKPRRTKFALPGVKPDIDKLERSILDAMEGTIYTNDSRVVFSVNRKSYAGDDGPGVRVTVWRMDEEAAQYIGERIDEVMQWTFARQ